jgi:SM-20-related protein
MPLARTFQQLGFFVRPGFLDGTECMNLIEAMSGASRDYGGIVSADGAEIVDETRRRVSCARLDATVGTLIDRRFRGIIPELVSYFQVQLVDCECPDFLVYDPGAFYEWHRDTRPDNAAEYIRKRAVSAIVVLNGTDGAASTRYAGGSLRFQGVLDGPVWDRCPLPFEAEPGLLIAFKSNILHEVTPVTAGRRFSVVTWYVTE